MAKALKDLERLTSGQVRHYKRATNYEALIEIVDWGTSDSGASICISLFPQVAAYCAALACPDLAFSSINIPNHLETTETPLSTEPRPASEQDEYPPGTVSGLVTLLMYAARLPDANSDTLSVVISSVNGPERIDFRNEPNNLPVAILDFIRKRAGTGGPITRTSFGHPLVNIIQLIVRLGLIVLVCTGANITPLAALLTADIFGLKVGRYDFRPGSYRIPGTGVQNAEFTVTWHSSIHTHIIASKRIACARSSAVIASYGVAWLCWFFRDTTRAWLGLQPTQASPQWLKSCGLALILAGVIGTWPIVDTFYCGMRRLYFHGDLHNQRNHRLSFSLCFKIVGPFLGATCIVLSTLICPALYLWNAGLELEVWN
ncbi:hypothetical protein BDD12DRAFT_810648 [Trichophaea hybrida]|nr:hypothetical protein BDD12DRAFT_810648 [Trichophaea hybrida]